MVHSQPDTSTILNIIGPVKGGSTTMTVSTIDFQVTYAGNDSTTAFPIPFPFLLNAYIEASIRDADGVVTLLVETTDYTLTGAGEATGTLTLPAVLATGKTLIITRVVALTQTVDFVENGPLPAEVLEASLDKLAMSTQQLESQVSDVGGTAIRISSSVTDGPDLIINELAAGRAGKAVGFDAAGDVELQSGVGLWQAEWATSTLYGLRDVVKDDTAGADTKNIYFSAEEHTSGVWATDLAAGKWTLVIDVADFLAGTSNLSDVASPAVSFANIKQTATTAATGAVEIATQGEVDTGTDTARSVTPETLDGWSGRYAHPNHSGDVTSTGDGATVIVTDAVTTAKILDANVTLAKQADMATASLVGRDTAGTGTPEVLSATTARSLLNVGDGAAADQTGAEIKTAYEGEADTNAFDDAAVTKLGGVEALADVTDATNVAAAGAFMNSDVSTNGAVERTGAGTYVTILTKRDATTAPTADDDTGDGYEVGSGWIDVTADKEYICLDATSTAAVWTETTGGTGAGDVVGPGSAVDNRICTFDSTTGKLIQDSGIVGFETAGSTIVLGDGGAGTALSGDTDNVILGGGAAPAATSMSTSVVLGSDALNTGVCTGSGHVIIGESSGVALTTGLRNTFIGSLAGLGATTGGTNVGIGRNALSGAVTGNSNIAIGTSAGPAITSADDCIIIGSGAGTAITTGNTNTVIGKDAGKTITTTDNNIAIGFEAARNATTSTLTALGSEAAKAMTGSASVVIGFKAATLATSASNACIIGANAVDSGVLTGANTTALGARAGRNLSSGADNTLVGFQCADAATTMSASVVIGAEALGTGVCTSADNVILGHGAGAALTSGGGNVFLGANAGALETTGADQLFIANTNTTTPLIYGDFANNNIGFNTTDVASGAGVLAIANGTAPTGTPTGGGIFYVLNGAARFKGSSGTDTEIAPA